MTEIRISVMDNRFFLYLPLFSACRREVLKRAGLREAFRVQSAIPRTDEGAIQCLLTPRMDGEPQAHIAACDPILVLSDAYIDEDFVVLGAIVGNNAFFAVDHRSVPVAQFSDLAKYDEIVAFQKGTTSHAIATRAKQLSKGEKLRIRETEPFRETEVLTEKVPYKRVILTPNVLEIEQLRETHPTANVELDLGQSPDFADQIVTALVARRTFVEAHSDLLQKFLVVLQAEICGSRAIADNEELIDYASGRFAASQTQVRGAIARANSSQLWPPSIGISYPQWLAAVRASLGWRLKFDTQNQEIHTRETYKRYVDPFRTLVDRAANDGQALYNQYQREKREPTPFFIKYLDAFWPYFLLIAGVVMGLTGRPGHPVQLIGVILVSIAVFRLAASAWRIRHGRHLLLIYGAFAVVSLGAVLATTLTGHDGSVVASIAKIVCGATSGQLLAAMRDYFKTRESSGK